MKLSFLFIAGLLISGLIFVSMTESTKALITIIDNVEVTDPGTLASTYYVIDRSTGPGAPTGDITIRGTQTETPVANQSNGHNYKCSVSQQICYQCTGCKYVLN